MLSGDLYSRITWFHRRQTTQDVDNISKNVHDGLIGVVFANDVQIVQCLTVKVFTGGDYEIVDHPGSSGIFEELLTLLAANHEHVLYVEVGMVHSHRAVLGPIDGANE